MKHIDEYLQYHRGLDRAAAPFTSSGRGSVPERVWSPRLLPVALTTTLLVRISLRGCGSPCCRIFVRPLDLTVREAAINCGAFPIGQVFDPDNPGVVREFLLVAPTLAVAEVAYEVCSGYLADERAPHGGRADYVHAGNAETGIDAADVVFGPDGGIALSERCWANHLWHSVRAPWPTRWKCQMLPSPRG
jgi:hypothetical protein